MAYTGPGLSPTDLYALADTLQMELYITGKEKIRGKATERFPVKALKVNLMFPMEVVSSRLGGASAFTREIALIVKVRGPLHLLALYEAGESLVHVFVFNDKAVKPEGTLTNWFELNDRKSLSSMVSQITAKAVASAQYDVHGKVWVLPSVLALP